MKMIEDLILDNFGKVLSALLVATFFGLIWLSEASCEAKTKGIGFNVEWSLMGGCRIEHKEGQWIPLERYRIVKD